VHILALGRIGERVVDDDLPFVGDHASAARSLEFSQAGVFEDADSTLHRFVFGHVGFLLCSWFLMLGFSHEPAHHTSNQRLSSRFSFKLHVCQFAEGFTVIFAAVDTPFLKVEHERALSFVARNQIGIIGGKCQFAVITKFEKPPDEWCGLVPHAGFLLCSQVRTSQ
jgi:hypothetical protein